MDYNLQIYNDFGSQLESKWDEFEKNSANYCFQNLYWLKNWYSNLENNKHIEIRNILVYKNSELKIILPLCIEKYKNIKYLKWQGGERADYMSGLFTNDFKIDKNEFLHLWILIKDKINQFDIVYLEKQPRFIDNISNPFVEFLHIEKDYFSSSISLEKSYEEFAENNLKKKFINDTKRSWNILSKNGSLNFVIHDIKNEEEKKQITKEILTQKIQRIKELKLKDGFNEGAKKFYVNFDNTKFKNGELQISSLDLNGKSISLHWGIIYKQRFYYLIPTMPNTEFMKYSPGRILLQNLIKWCIDKKFDKLDFTIGDEPYKKDWYNVKSTLFCCIEKNNLKYFLIYLLLKSKIRIMNFLKSSMIIKSMHRQIIRMFK